jgi:hypothetical protein
MKYSKGLYYKFELITWVGMKFELKVLWAWLLTVVKNHLWWSFMQQKSGVIISGLKIKLCIL